MRRLFVVLVPLLVVGTLGGVASAATPKQFSLAPTSGPAGSSVTVTSRDRCQPPGGTSNPVSVVTIAPAGGAAVATATVPVDSRGSWRATLQIPVGTTTGAKDVAATCRFSNGTAVFYG